MYVCNANIVEANICHLFICSLSDNPSQEKKELLSCKNGDRHFNGGYLVKENAILPAKGVCLALTLLSPVTKLNTHHGEKKFVWF